MGRKQAQAIQATPEQEMVIAAILGKFTQALAHNLPRVGEGTTTGQATVNECAQLRKKLLGWANDSDVVCDTTDNIEMMVMSACAAKGVDYEEDTSYEDIDGEPIYDIPGVVLLYKKDEKRFIFVIGQRVEGAEVLDLYSDGRSVEIGENLTREKGGTTYHLETNRDSEPDLHLVEPGDPHVERLVRRCVSRFGTGTTLKIMRGLFL